MPNGSTASTGYSQHGLSYLIELLLNRREEKEIAVSQSNQRGKRRQEVILVTVVGVEKMSVKAVRFRSEATKHV